MQSNLRGSKRSISCPLFIRRNESGYLPYRQSDRVCSFCCVCVLFLGAFDTREWGRRKSAENCFVACSRVVRGRSALSCLLCSSTRLRPAFSASKAFVWRTGSPHSLHRRGCGVGLRRESPQRAQQQQQQQRCCKMVIDDTHCCHRMTVRVRAAGGRRTGCAKLTRCEQQQQQHHQ